MKKHFRNERASYPHPTAFAGAATPYLTAVQSLTTFRQNLFIAGTGFDILTVNKHLYDHTI